MTLTHALRPRRAIGLVELMVAMALSIGIMWILAESFKMGLDFTRHARSTGSMMTQLDGARAVLARDLLAEHFLRDENKPNGGVRLSDQRLDWLNNSGQGWSPPTGGFVRIISPTVDTLQTVYDTDNFAMNTAANHAIHMTSILPATDQNPYSATIGTTVFTSRAAEVAYLLVDSGLRTSPDPTLGRPLYNLIRRQRLVALTADEVTALAAGVLADTNADVIAHNGTQARTLADIRDPSVRLNVQPSALPPVGSGPPTFGISHARYGEDLLLSNVLSFEVMVDWAPNVNGVNGPVGSRLGPRPFTGDPAVSAVSADRQPSYPGLPNSDYPFDHLGAIKVQNNVGPGVFDTWIGSPLNPTWNIGLNTDSPNAQKLPLAVRVKQMRITIRIFDTKTKQARQSSIVVDM
jgi:hypothetical protein